MKIAIIIPNPIIKGGVVRAAVSIARFLTEFGDKSSQVVLAINGNASLLEDNLPKSLRANVETRPISFEKIPNSKLLAMLNGVPVSDYPQTIQPEQSWALVRDNGLDLMDCDIWIQVTNRVVAESELLPIAPLRPIGLFPFDFLEAHGYANFDQKLFEASVRIAKSVDLVFVSTHQTRNDAIAYMGCEATRVIKMPLEYNIELHECFDVIRRANNPEVGQQYAMWVTNSALHKNHARTLQAINEAHKLSPDFKCKVIGFNVENILVGEQDLFQDLIDAEVLEVLGFVSDETYCSLLSNSKFLLHSAVQDNGSFSPLEAAQHGIQSVVARYPAMEEIASEYGLGCTWFDPYDSYDIADKIVAAWSTSESTDGSAVTIKNATFVSVAEKWNNSFKHAWAGQVVG